MAHCMTPDPFGRAIRDHHEGTRREPLVQRDGSDVSDHPVEEFYFGEYGGDEWLDGWLDGPLLDMGAGAGKHALYYQERVETVALDVSENLVAVMDDRGVEDPRTGDMFALRGTFERDRFGSALAVGTQLGLAGSMGGLREFLDALASITRPDGTALLDCYDPDREGTAGLLGYRHDPTPGLASRVMEFEYRGEVGEILLFRLFGPGRIRAATTGTPWRVEEVRYTTGFHYQVALAKR